MFAKLKSKRQVRCTLLFFEDRSGTTAVEYGILSAFIGLALFMVADIVGVRLTGAFENVEKSLGGAAKSGGSAGSGNKSGSGNNPALVKLRGSN